MSRLPREERRITAAIRSRKYWESELAGLSEGPHVMGVAYRWLLALRKVQRPRHWRGGAASIADLYLNEISRQMLAYARAISEADQMTDVQAEEHWRKVWQQETARRKAAS